MLRILFLQHSVCVCVCGGACICTYMCLQDNLRNHPSWFLKQCLTDLGLIDEARLTAQYLPPAVNTSPHQHTQHFVPWLLRLRQAFMLTRQALYWLNLPQAQQWLSNACYLSMTLSTLQYVWVQSLQVTFYPSVNFVIFFQILLSTISGYSSSLCIFHIYPFTSHSHLL